MRRTFFYTFLALLMGTTLFSCSKKKNDRTDTPTSGAISIASDESFSPIIDEERKVFQANYPKANITPIYTSESEAVKLFTDKKVRLVFTSRKLNDKELEYMRAKRIVTETFPIGYDGIAFITNRENTDTCITVTDLKRILLGEASDWGQVYSGSKRGPIQVVFDNSLSGTLRYVQDSILGGKTINSPNIVAAKTSKEVISYVDKTPNAIGVISSLRVTDRRDTTNTTFNKDIHVLRVSSMDTATPRNSWQPYQAYLLDERYPFCRTLYAIVADSHNGLAWSFSNFITSPKGQLVMFKSGLLPMRGDITIKTVDVKRK